MATLRVNRVKTIMKTSDGTDFVGKDAAWLVARATELFIRKLAGQAYKTSHKTKKLQYEHLINVIHKEAEYEFLKIMVPKKITVLEFHRLMAKKQDKLKDYQEAGSSKNCQPSRSKK